MELSDIEKITFIFIGFLFFCIFVAFGAHFYICFHCAKLSKYLKKNKYHRWRELSSVGRFGPGLANIFRGMRYIRSDQDNDDETILRQKDAIRIGYRYRFFAFGAMVFTIIIIAVLIYIASKSG